MNATFASTCAKRELKHPPDSPAKQAEHIACGGPRFCERNPEYATRNLLPAESGREPVPHQPESSIGQPNSEIYFDSQIRRDRNYPPTAKLNLKSARHSVQNPAQHSTELLHSSSRCLTLRCDAAKCSLSVVMLTCCSQIDRVANRMNTRYLCDKIVNFGQRHYELVHQSRGCVNASVAP